MREYRLALATAAATFLLLVIGGVVHATGSSLACPDWPLCHGQVFPTMKGGVPFEHGHRLAAATVAVLTVCLASLVFLRRRDRSLRVLAGAAVALVLVQAALGGITVVYKLPLLVSTGHFATSMAFFCTIIYLAYRLRPTELPAPAGPRWPVGVAALATYGQLVLGAFVRHTGSGLACNTRLPLCDGVLWPSFGPAQVHMAHRLAGVALAVIVTAACVRPARDALRADASGRAALALAAPVLVVFQIALGLLTVATYISVPVVTLHLAGGALLLADLLVLFLSLGGRAARESAAACGALASAAG
jgi:heme A synthase